MNFIYPSLNLLYRVHLNLVRFNHYFDPTFLWSDVIPGVIFKSQAELYLLGGGWYVGNHQDSLPLLEDEGKWWPGHYNEALY